MIAEKIKSAARAEGIELTPAGEPIFARDLARFAEIRREVSDVEAKKTLLWELDLARSKKDQAEIDHLTAKLADFDS